ncbi:MAG: hypothetical protein GY948_18235 [Alphaproteobacteria bacterium]|nr:hypothetical protein [Alphaproteobacteria bacterium]
MSMQIKSACAAAVIWLGLSTAAFADQIDGTWCSPSGQSMTIDGSNVRTPGGKSITGRYSRHRFDYEIPDGEPQAGGRIIAEQLNDREIRVTIIKQVQAEPGAHETWTRCDVVS